MCGKETQPPLIKCKIINPMPVDLYQKWLKNDGEEQIIIKDKVFKVCRKCHKYTRKRRYLVPEKRYKLVKKWTKIIFLSLLGIALVVGIVCALVFFIIHSFGMSTLHGVGAIFMIVLGIVGITWGAIEMYDDLNGNNDDDDDDYLP